jgi:deazaflavin-dependent oxidoreductase (nitroreductase family)
MPSTLGNAFMKAIIVSPLHGLMGDRFGLIAVTGRKTGRRISTPVNVSLQDGEYLVIRYRNRTWWRNLLDGREGKLHHRGKTFPVSARVLDRAPGILPVLKTYFKAYPGREKYFGIRTDRGALPGRRFNPSGGRTGGRIPYAASFGLTLPVARL